MQRRFDPDLDKIGGAGQVEESRGQLNLPGRSGPGQLYLASPYTVAASAMAGQIVAWEPHGTLVGA